MKNMREIKSIYLNMLNQLSDNDGLGISVRMLVEQYIWYSIGELICSCQDENNSDGGYDLCGSLMIDIIGSNSFCHEVIFAVRNNESQYVQTMSQMVIQDKLVDLGTFWRKFIREGKDKAVEQLIAFLKLYSNEFLPAIKHQMDEWSLKYYPDYYSNVLSKAIRVKQKTADALNQKLAGFIETKYILSNNK